MGLPTLFGAIVLLGSAALLLFANVTALHSNMDAIRLSQKVLAQVANLETGIQGEELAIRGYALTGDGRFLDFQDYHRKQTEDALTVLQPLMASDPRRAAQYRQVSGSVKAHLEIFGKLRGNGPDRASVVAKAIVDPPLRRNMQDVREELSALRETEVNYLGSREGQMTNQITRAFELAIGIMVAAFVLGGLGVWIARLQFPQRLSGPQR
jgi:CHASE3 domain.